MIETTTRKGIKVTFNKLSNIQWNTIFFHERANNLEETIIRHTLALTAMPPRHIKRYNIKKVGQWLVDHGYYTIKEIEEVLGS